MKQWILWILVFLSTSVGAQKKLFNSGTASPKNYFEEIPLEVINHKLIIPVEIQGETYRFLLDTGAPNMLSEELYQKIQPEVIQEINVSDANGIQKPLEVIVVPALKIGEVTFTNNPALVYNDDENSIFDCFEIDGIIGSNLLRNSIVQIDTQRKRVLLTTEKSKLALNRKEATKMYFIDEQSSPYIWIYLENENRAREQVMVDTGMNGLYDITKEHYELFHTKSIFREIAKSTGASSLGLFGEVPVQEQYKAQLPTMSIGNLNLHNATVITNEDDNSRIGATLLDYCVLTLDYKHKRVYVAAFTPEIDVKKADFGFSRTLIDGKLVVGFVWDEQLKNQLHYGDEIVTVNGHAVFMCDAMKIPNYFDEKEQLQLTIAPKNGELYELTLTKKYP